MKRKIILYTVIISIVLMLGLLSFLVWKCMEDNANQIKSGMKKNIDNEPDNTINYIDSSLSFAIGANFSEGLAVVENKQGKCGYIDKTGKLIIECEYDSAWDFEEGLAAVEKNEKYGYINKQGKLVVDFQYDNAFVFMEGLALVEKEGKYGYIDKSGNVVSDCQYDNASRI